MTEQSIREELKSLLLRHGHIEWGETDGEVVAGVIIESPLIRRIQAEEQGRTFRAAANIAAGFDANRDPIAALSAAARQGDADV